MSMNPRLLRPAASGFSPRSISGLALWLDASDGATLFQNSDGTVPATATSDPVGAWLDKSGNGRHAVQATAGSRPTISANTQGGKKMLGFDGTNGRLTIPFPVTAADPVSMIAVARRGSSSWGGGGGGGYGSLLNSSNSSSGGPQLRVDTGNIEVIGGSNKSGISGANVGVGSCAIIEGMVSSLATSLYVQGALVDSDAGTGAISTSGTRTSIGAWNDGTQGGGPLAGDIAELICYRASLTTSQRQRLERYLAAKWGITLAPTVSNADAQDWVNRVYQNGGTVTSRTAAAVNTLCDSLDASGVRPLMYRMGIFAGTGLNAALVPLYRGPSLGGTQYGGTTDINVGAGPFVSGDYAETGASGGLVGNGSSKYLNTGLNANSIGTEGHAAMYHRASIANAGAAMLRVSDGASHIFGLDYSTGVSNMRGFWGSTGTVAFGSTSGGLHAITRRSATDLEYYRNGDSVGTQATSVTPTAPAQPFYVFASNQNGTPGIYSAANLQAYSLGLSMTASQVSAYSTAMSAFQTALSRA